MQSLINFSTPLEEIYTQSLCSRQISRNHLQQLQLLHRVYLLEPQQNRLIKRLLHALRRGWLRVTD